MYAWLCDSVPTVDSNAAACPDGSIEHDDGWVPPTSRSGASGDRARVVGGKPLEAALMGLHAAQADHPFWQNRLFKACAAGALTREDYKLLFSQYYLYSRSFTRYLAALMANCEDDLLRSRLTENIWDEGGGAAPEQRHAEIFRRFLRHGLGVDVDNIEFLDSTRLFVREYLDFCVHAHPAAGAAFLSLGTEGIVSRMYGTFLHGLLRAGVAEEHTAFFRIHMACDDEHAHTLEQIMMGYASIPDWYATCRRSMDHALALRQRFFEQMYDAIQARRVRGVLNKIQGGVSLAPEQPGPAEIWHHIGAPGVHLYANVNERLGIDFGVERVPFGSDVFDTRVLRVAPHANNERHKHPYESMFYVIEGRGRVHVNQSSLDVGPGDLVFVPRWAMHQSFNTGDEELVILAVTDFGLTEQVYVGNQLKFARLRGTQTPRGIGDLSPPALAPAETT